MERAQLLQGRVRSGQWSMARVELLALLGSEAARLLVPDEPRDFGFPVSEERDCPGCGWWLIHRFGCEHVEPREILRGLAEKRWRPLGSGDLLAWAAWGAAHEALLWAALTSEEHARLLRDLQVIERALRGDQDAGEDWRLQRQRCGGFMPARWGNLLSRLQEVQWARHHMRLRRERAAIGGDATRARSLRSDAVLARQMTKRLRDLLEDTTWTPTPEP